MKSGIKETRLFERLNLTDRTRSQWRAIRSESDRTVVVAGPGSGKTQTLIDRIHWLVEVKRVKPSEIVVITYTNAAADEIRERLFLEFTHYRSGNRLGHCGTLHSFMLRLLRLYGDLTGYKAETLSLFPEDEIGGVLAEIRDRLGFRSLSMKKLMEYDRGQSYLDSSNHLAAPESRVWIAFNRMLKENNSIDYDSILLQGFNLLRFSVVFQNVGEQFKYLFVDEVQDSAHIDAEIYTALPIENKFYVGDPDQAIYGFRGGDDSFLKEQFARAGRAVILEENFRSSPPVCKAANDLISFNLDRIEKKTQPTCSQPDSSVCLWKYKTDLLELVGIGDKIENLEFAFNGHREIAVLVRTNALAKWFRDGFEGLDIPVKDFRTKDRLLPGLQWLQMAVSLLCNPDNDLLYAAALKKANIGHLNGLQQRARKESLSLNRYLEKYPVENTEGVFPVPYGMNPGEVPHWLNRTNVMIHSNTFDFLLQCVADAGDDGTISDLSRLLRESDPDKSESGDAGVEVLTLHSAKGREWDYVFLPAFEKEYFEKHGDDVENERRLAYVGFTRARIAVYVTYAQKRNKEWKGFVDVEPSQFVEEAGLNHGGVS